jgi:hypothetical protein
MTMLTSKPLFYELVTFTKLREKNVLYEKGDEITRFDGT